MKRINLILNGPSYTETVKAYKVNDFFAVHPNRPRSPYWSVTHIPSGLRMGSPEIRGRALAAERADAILDDVREAFPDFDWDGDSYDALKAINRREDFTPAFQVARRAVYGETE